MCLGVPGRIISVETDKFDPFCKTAQVDFDGIIKNINISYVPDASIGDYVIVHVGIAISKIDEIAAKKTFEYLNELAEKL